MHVLWAPPLSTLLVMLLGLNAIMHGCITNMSSFGSLWVGEGHGSFRLYGIYAIWPKFSMVPKERSAQLHGLPKMRICVTRYVVLAEQVITLWRTFHIRQHAVTLNRNHFSRKDNDWIQSKQSFFLGDCSHIYTIIFLFDNCVITCSNIFLSQHILYMGKVCYYLANWCCFVQTSINTDFRSRV